MWYNIKYKVLEKLTFAILFGKACVLLMKKKSNKTYIILLLLLYLNVRLTGTITYPLIFSVN